MDGVERRKAPSAVSTKPSSRSQPQQADDIAHLDEMLARIDEDLTRIGLPERRFDQFEKWLEELWPGSREG